MCLKAFQVSLHFEVVENKRSIQLCVYGRYCEGTKISPFPTVLNSRNQHLKTQSRGY